MTFTSKRYQPPRCLKITKPTKSVQLPIHGQGVLIFDASEPCCLTFCDSRGVVGLNVQFTDTAVLVHLEPSHEPLIDSTNTKGLVKQQGAYYWFSLDAQNQRLSAGIGEARKETAIYSFEFTQGKELRKALLETLVSVNLEHLQLRRILRDPITKSVPLLVKSTDEITLESLALGEHIYKSNLSTIAHKLYDCISGKMFVLNTPDFPDFSDAIEYSIRTPGKWCYECIQRKATEFDKDKPNEKETYLRITLGENNGESPGIPYVMEIWPVGHYSPIHNHGGSSAIIRVLHGSIHVTLFPFLSGDEVPPFGSADFKKEDITWISPGLNQIHQLKNMETNIDTCITIQCYMYKEDDDTHYDYFDYIDAGDHIQKFEPDSDMEFLEFKKTMRQEWLDAKSEKN